MRVIKGTSTNTDELKKAMESIPNEVRREIKETKGGKGYELRTRTLEKNSSGGYLANYLRTIMYALGLNGHKEVAYVPEKRITITSDGVLALQQIF